MDDYSWGATPFLGLVPHFHADPTQGGAPLPSADGHWWWTGLHWTPVQQPAAQGASLPVTAAETAQPAPTLAEAG
jgi:hypothetical protein